MQKLIFLILFLCWGHFTRAQVASEQTYDLTDVNTLLGVFFDSKQFSPEGHVLWKPMSFAETQEADLSADGWMHTGIDTILFFTTFNIRRAAIVFETLHFEEGGQPSDCHACGVDLSVAVFTAADATRWQLDKFAKHFTSLGSYGENGDAGLIQFGPEIWCLSLEMDWTGQGIYGEYVNYYDLDDLQKVFNFVLHEDNGGAFVEIPERTYALDKSIHFLTNIETTTGWWDFELVTRGTQPDDDVQRAVPANRVDRFAFNWETSAYMRVCP
jgi:hypothetical protein